MAWILLLQALLWQAWVRERHAAVIDEVTASLGIRVKTGWRSGILLTGSTSGARVHLRWAAGLREMTVRIRTRRGGRTRRWQGAPESDADTLLSRVRLLLDEAPAEETASSATPPA
jgi:hypothetical protein